MQRSAGTVEEDGAMKIVTGEDGPGPAVEAYLDGLSRSELHKLVLTPH